MPSHAAKTRSLCKALGKAMCEAGGVGCLDTSLQFLQRQSSRGRELLKQQPLPTSRKQQVMGAKLKYLPRPGTQSR